MKSDMEIFTREQLAEAVEQAVNKGIVKGQFVILEAIKKSVEGMERDFSQHELENDPAAKAVYTVLKSLETQIFEAAALYAECEPPTHLN